MLFYHNQSQPPAMQLPTSRHAFSFALFPSVYRSRRNVLLSLSLSLSLPLLPPQDVRPTEVCIRRNGTLHDPQLALFARSLFQEMEEEMAKKKEIVACVAKSNFAHTLRCSFIPS